MNKNFVITIAIIATIGLLIYCGISKNEIQQKYLIDKELFIKDSIARSNFVKDSIAKLKAKNDSINAIKTKQKNEIIERCSKLFTNRTDEFNNVIWVESKYAPKFRNQNGIYCYFAKTKNTAYNFRFVYQYFSDEWLFIQNMIFNIDGENITINPYMETDCGYGGKIWEWCDISVENCNVNGINEKFIKKLAYAKSVKIKMNGRQYYDTRVLTKNQIKNIKDSYEYFIALGGKFTN